MPIACVLPSDTLLKMDDDYEPTPVGNRIVTPPPEVQYVCDVTGCGFTARLAEIDPVYVVITKTATLVSCPACVARWLAKNFPKLRAVPIARRHETKQEASHPLVKLPPVQPHITTKRLFHKRPRSTPRTFRPDPAPKRNDPDDPFADA